MKSYFILQQGMSIGLYLKLTRAPLMFPQLSLTAYWTKYSPYLPKLCVTVLNHIIQDHKISQKHCVVTPSSQNLARIKDWEYWPRWRKTKSHGSLRFPLLFSLQVNMIWMILHDLKMAAWRLRVFSWALLNLCVTPIPKCVPFWNTCHPETCFRLAWCAILKNVHFWNMFQIGTVQTSSYRSRMLNARSRSIKMCAKKPHIRQAAFCLFVCLFVCLSFSNKCRATSNAMS